MIYLIYNNLCKISSSTKNHKTLLIKPHQFLHIKCGTYYPSEVYCPNNNPRSVSIIPPPPQLCFCPKHTFRMFSSLEIFVWSLYGNTFDHSKERTNIEKKQRKKYPSEFVKLWHLYEKNNVRNPQPFSQTIADYGWIQWTFPGFLNISCHISICFFTITWREYYELCLTTMCTIQYQNM